ncbi:g312 [Yersinia phage phiR1-37]|nr:hypothetical protein phiR1-37_gp312 [Yersinia phage phiR1-37]CCE26335.1 g312 [Yersinia phage phiR1-37]
MVLTPIKDYRMHKNVQRLSKVLMIIHRVNE